jgi:hypothetical protein
VSYFIPKEDYKHTLISDKWRKSPSGIRSFNSDSRMYAFALWLIDEKIEPSYRSGEYMGCLFKDQKEFLGWMLKNT